MIIFFMLFSPTLEVSRIRCISRNTLKKFHMWEQHLNLPVNHGNGSELLFLLEAYKCHGVTTLCTAR